MTGPSPTSPPSPTAAAPAPAAPSAWRRVRQWAGTPDTQLVALALLAAVLAGLLGGVLSARLLRHPEPPLRVGVINLTRLTQAVATHGLSDPAAGATFGARFDAAVKQLLAADPDRLLLVKEAVVGGGRIEDLTDAILPLFEPLSPRKGRPAPQLDSQAAPEN